MRTRTYHLVCFLVLLATLGVAEATPCQAARLTAQVQSSTREAAHQATTQAGPIRASGQPAAESRVAVATATPAWRTTLPPARTAALQAHTTRA